MHHSVTIVTETINEEDEKEVKKEELRIEE